ncbi:MAG: OmpH family outer membrane protein [Sphingomonadaceae bacterium]|uniref:OmpH family outer membrane protein n=1 Tax=Thermaurantiacus sp. TaxID=2820283 RepID=UPI00298F3538|nr:OmpH family outer membrane protein [Thermaurantiacus sp.]MCS6986546.1 OmpH family outer membrane protein [Sphingomonadaceae bacterium]MDW8414193.1 OmpH family outer membrane protein [Thermaurantiacus sp.]
MRILLFVAPLMAAPAAAQQLSPAVIVVVDLDRVVAESAAGKAAVSELQTRANALRARAQTLGSQLQADAQAIQQGQASKTLQGPQLEQRVKALQEKESAARAEIGKGEEELARAQQYVLQQINTAVQPIISQIMRERGAAIVLAQQATIQHSASLNITNEVLARLNAALPKVSTTPPAAPPAPAR